MSYTQFINYLFAKADGKAVPLSGTFELTARCNLNCKMCYIHKKENDTQVIKNELSTSEWLNIAKTAKEMGMLLLLITGGEPLLRPDFRTIYTECKNMGLIVSINTNATLINEDMIDFFTQNPPARINITIYGASSQTYEKMCGDAKAYDKVINAILKLKEAGIQIKLNYSYTQYNKEDTSLIYEFAKKNDIEIQTATYMFPPVRACENKYCTIERITPLESAIAKIQYDEYRFTKDELYIYFSKIVNGIQVIDKDNECQDFPTEKIKCRAGSTSFWITYDGQMRPCGMMQIPTVNINQSSFKSAWTQIRDDREKIMIPAQCTNCEFKHFCEFCPATCFAENGDFEKSPEYICNKSREYLNLAKLWLEENKK